MTITKLVHEPIALIIVPQRLKIDVLRDSSKNMGFLW